ncbi:MAG: DUF4124 domain-containing protein [Dokdonella sp.]|uniref:DUF4124 domain-containing protein n=1 Tax=Dokdonella sp. TaxID=2291710 RepID=UPI0032630C38
MRSVILLAAFAAVPVAAGEVYKCKGPKGDITFTNIKCPEHTDTERYATYEPEPEPPLPSPTTPDPGEAAPSFANVVSSDASGEPAMPALPPPGSPSAESSLMPVEQPVDPAHPPVAAESASLPAGYKCSDGQTMWLQSTPCPAASARALPAAGEASAPEAAPATASTASTQTLEIPPASSSQSALCEQLIAQVGSPEHRNDGPGTDELNKLLAANGCKH